MYVRKTLVARILGVLQGTCVDILGAVVVRIQDASHCGCIVGHPATLVLINHLLLLQGVVVTCSASGIPSPSRSAPLTT